VKKGETLYSINWIPLGGFVKIKGEQGEDPDDEDSFIHKKIWQRAIILISGVLMNFILTVVLLSIGYFVGLPQDISEAPAGANIRNAQIETVTVLKDSPAGEAGILPGDVIVSLDGRVFSQADEFRQYTKDKEGQALTLVIKRGAETLTKVVTPKKIPEADQAVVGVGLIKTGVVSYPWYKALYKGAEATLVITGEIFKALYNLVKDLVTAKGVSMDVSGPVGIAVLTGRVARMGFIYLVQFTALLSINLAIINFIPFPALDGGRLLFLVIEKIRRKPVSRKIEAVIHTIGFSLLMLLVLVVTYRDVARYSDKFVSLWQRIIR
jgi:regulator of sigma E protease